jgi:hypothetical protein
VKYSGGRLTGFALLLWLFVAAQSQVAFAQSGSTGGVIGKQDKSVSGGEDVAEPHAVKKSQRRPIEGSVSDRSSDVSVVGRWHYSADCASGHWQGELDLAEMSKGQFSGSFDVGTITNVHVNGTSVTFTRTWVTFTQYWIGRLVGGRLKGTLSGNENCSWEASRK